MSSLRQAIIVHGYDVNKSESKNKPSQLTASNTLEALVGISTTLEQRQLHKTHSNNRQGNLDIRSSVDSSLIEAHPSLMNEVSYVKSNPSTPTTQIEHTWPASVAQQFDQMITDDDNSSAPHLPGRRSRRVRFKSLLTPSVINESDEVIQSDDISRTEGQELIDLASLTQSSNSSKLIHSESSGAYGGGNKKRNSQQEQQQTLLNEIIPEEDQDHLLDSDIVDFDDENNHHESNFFDEDYENPDNLTDDEDADSYVVGDLRLSANIQSASPSHHKLKQRGSFVSRFYWQLRHLTSDIKDRLVPSSGESSVAYTAYEQNSRGELVSTGVRDYRRLKRAPKRKSPEQNFRGPYRYSRINIVMTVFKKLLSFLFQRSTLALFGAFLIHVTLGTIYTLSNINSYLTSYMRLNGTPNATYGGSMWISSSYAVGQGFSMILGGLIEKRFSARVSCILGCALHSLSVMSTSRSINYGQLAVLFTYGFLPGFGCGLAYMTPMSNGFGWFPHRKGLVAGTILAGFGIGTFVFNMAQTAYVNPHNLSPLPTANGYFTQKEILDNVPHLFTFLGTIYACMQFVGCCLLFQPPNQSGTDVHGKRSILSDERPILAEANDMTFQKAIRTREFFVLFLVFGITNQGVLFVNSMLKEYGQIFIADDLYLAWTGSMASIANSLGRLVWGLAIDRYSFTVCFTLITTIFGALIFLMPFEFILSSKLLYLLCTLGIFGSFSGWMSTYPVHLSRIFGLRNSGMVYGLIFVSQSIGGIFTAFAAHYLIDHYSRFVPFFCVTFLEVVGLSIYHLFYNK